jgi:hypothetical protein
LDQLKLTKNTIVIYFSDNGPNGHRWNDGMKGIKGTTDEGGVRSPLIMQWPGKLKESFFMVTSLRTSSSSQELIFEGHTDTVTSDRKSFYEGQGVDKLNNWYSFLKWIYIILLVIYAFGMIFPTDPLGLVRHPSQIYQALCEGLILFIILWWFSAKPRPRMAVSALFLMGYGVARFFMEFFRQPDADQGFILFGWMTKGQILTVPMLLIGLWMMWYAYQKKIYDWQIKK